MVAAGRPNPSQFDEAAYLAAHADVRAAVAAGAFASGAAHYETFGRVEGRALRPENGPAKAELFDEADYLAAHPDVRAAVNRGIFASGAAHYQAFGRQEQRPLRLRVLQSVAELDHAIAKLHAEFEPGTSAWLRARQSFAFREDVDALPKDPLSPEYRDSQLALYSLISGRPGYDARTAEPGHIDIASYVDPTPYPFRLRDAGIIGCQLVEIGHIFQTLWQHKPGVDHAVLEYGCGTGVATIMMAAAGYRVTAVDINPDALAVVDAIAADRRLAVRTFHGEFGDVPAEGETFDIILFYEAFHHGLEFHHLLRTLHCRLAPGGILVLAGEPIYRDFPKPWGLRLDGASLWEIRCNGWLELGFREDFLLALLGSTGWHCTKVPMPPPANDVYVARRDAPS